MDRKSYITLDFGAPYRACPFEIPHDIDGFKIDFGQQMVLISFQVLAGGRGKGHLTSGLKGGVKICGTPLEVEELSSRMLTYKLITHQTTSEGEPVKKVLIHQGVDIKREFYLAIMMDRKNNGPVLVASPMGGMDIEEVSQTNPEAVRLTPINIATGISPSQCRDIAKFLLEGYTRDERLQVQMADQISKLYDMFIKYDCTMIEVNPLAVGVMSNTKETTSKGECIVCIDAKLGFDDSAAYRQKTVFSLEGTYEYALLCFFRGRDWAGCTVSSSTSCCARRHE